MAVVRACSIKPLSMSVPVLRDWEPVPFRRLTPAVIRMTRIAMTATISIRENAACHGRGCCIFAGKSQELNVGSGDKVARIVPTRSKHTNLGRAKLDRSTGDL